MRSRSDREASPDPSDEKALADNHAHFIGSAIVAPQPEPNEPPKDNGKKIN